MKYGCEKVEENNIKKNSKLQCLQMHGHGTTTTAELSCALKSIVSVYSVPL